MAKNLRINMQIASDQRAFTMIYHDFMDSKKLNRTEKDVFIVLKRYADAKGQCYPSYSTIAEKCQMSKKTVMEAIKNLVKKGVVKIEKRKDADDGEYTSNLYTIYDYASTWKEENVDNDAITLEKEIQDAWKGLELLMRKGLISATDQSTDIGPQKKNLSIINNTTNKEICQESQPESKESNLSMEQIYQIFGYKILINDRPENREMVDAVMEILMETLNSQSKTIRINKEAKPADVVKARMMKLTYMHINYAIDSFNRQTEKIKNLKAYMLTTLYNSYITMDLYYKNLVNHDIEQGFI